MCDKFITVLSENSRAADLLMTLEQFHEGRKNSDATEGL